MISSLAPSLYCMYNEGNMCTVSKYYIINNDQHTNRTGRLAVKCLCRVGFVCLFPVLSYSFLFFYWQEPRNRGLPTSNDTWAPGGSGPGLGELQVERALLFNDTEAACLCGHPGYYHNASVHGDACLEDTSKASLRNTALEAQLGGWACSKYLHKHGFKIISHKHSFEEVL